MIKLEINELKAKKRERILNQNQTYKKLKKTYWGMAKLIWRCKKEEPRENMERSRWEHYVQPMYDQYRVYNHKPGSLGETANPGKTHTLESSSRGTRRELSAFVKSKMIETLNTHIPSYTSSFMYTYKTHTCVHTHTLTYSKTTSLRFHWWCEPTGKEKLKSVFH